MQRTSWLGVDQKGVARPMSVQAIKRTNRLLDQQEVEHLRRENASLRRELSEVRDLAYRDCLTGLLNRRSFEERLREECARVRRSANYCFALILLDLDDFKAINDTYGHTVGDDVLTTVARLLQRCVREVDLTCRVGGDEFAVLLPSTTYSGGHVVERRIRCRLSTALSVSRVPVGVSMGLSACPPGEPDPSTIIKAADEALYREKRARKTTSM